MIQQSISIRHQLSAVIYVTDMITGRAVDRQRLTFMLEPTGITPIYKNEGYYVYSNLPAGIYRLIVHSLDYGIVTRQWEWNPQQKDPPVFQLLLQPSPAYSFATKITRIYCRCVDVVGAPITDVPLTLYSRSPENSRARLRKKTNVEDQVLEVATTGVRSLAGESYLLCSMHEDIEQNEQIEIKSFPQLNDQVWQLISPLSHSYTAGALLLPIVRATTDHRGEAVLVIRSLPSSKGQFELVAGYSDQKPYMSKMLTIQEYEVISLQLTISDSC